MYGDGETYRDFAPYILYIPNEGEVYLDGLLDGEAQTFDVFEIETLRVTNHKFTPSKEFTITCMKHDDCSIGSIYNQQIFT